jgi:DNA primase catalytic subunit
MESHLPGNQDYFRNREFSFTLPGDVYTRYRSFSSPEELRDALVKVPNSFIHASSSCLTDKG